MIDPRRPNFESTPVSPDRARFGYAPSPLARGEERITPAVTVVTPFFNTGPVFHETAACLLGRGTELPPRGIGQTPPPGQSLQNFEWIIVNDASTDAKALQVLEHYRALARHDARIRIIDHATNHGLPATRNTGWQSAAAPLVFFLDSDDLIEPTTLEKCALYLACNPDFAFVKGYSVGFGAQEYLWDRGFHSGPAMLEQNLVTATTMVRTSVLRRVGGFDESIRRGMEDWEFWLRAAALGHWGDTIPEHLDWYRRRDNQHDAWENIASGKRREEFLSRIRAAHKHIFEGKFPGPERAWHMPFAYPMLDLRSAKGPDIPQTPVLNPLVKNAPRLLMIAPWLRMGGADRFNLDLVRYLTTRAAPNWEVTIATTLPKHPWLPEFAALTPDVFLLDHLARLPHYPALLSHLIASRRPDVVMVTNSQLGYFLLPLLRSLHPETTFVDFNHMEEPHWQNGGHPRTGAGFQDQLDLSIVVSGHLKKWMSQPPRNADAERIEVCHINADSTTFRPDAAGRAEWRGELRIDDDTPVILYAARLCPQKQPMVFARTMELLLRGTGVPPVAGAGASAHSRPVSHADSMLAARPHGQDAHATKAPFVALVAGDGEYYGELEAFIHAKGLSGHVRMLGSVPAGRMPSLMAAADIFFLPSEWEGIALSFYEAMAAGLCIVGADVGGQKELVTPETGILLEFPERDGELEARAYAQMLGSLIADPARMSALGSAARARIREHFELDVMGRRMLGIFERAHRWRREYPRQTISAGMARELALQGVEMMRIQELAEEIWPYRQKYLELVRGPGASTATSGEEAQRNAEAAATLAHLEASRPWRMIQAVKSTPPYKLLARARFGADWQFVDPKEPAEVRLARIRGSRAYKLAKAMGRLDPN